ncbi:hypothetical protein CGCVW01_v006583 [Colletotrichum viniferum]|nr:hypothetical protein CGCVW01_v006583 [Colletotrichum viniferum]
MPLDSSESEHDAHIEDPNESHDLLPHPSQEAAEADVADRTQDDGDNSASDVNSPTLDYDAAKENELQLREQARIEQETQDIEANWRRRLQTSTSTPSNGPSLVIGAPLGKNLTAIEAASRLVTQWEAIYNQTLSSTPAGAPSVLESLTQARTQLAALQSSVTEDVETPLNSLQDHKQTSIASRIQTLEAALEESTFPPEHANISAAISLYRTSRIPYSSNWAVIYAGHLVDFAPTYTSFTADRADRLDRYARMHGEGWLWFEPPLARAAAPLFSASRGTWVPETDTTYDMGHYSVTMSFRRMRNLVYHPGPPSRKRRRGQSPQDVRWPVPTSPVEKEESPLDPANPLPRQKPNPNPLPPSTLRRCRPSRHPHMTPDPAEATLHFRMLLDTGATLPMLHTRDAAALGIERKSYAAVSCISVETAGPDLLRTWLYEMQVSVADTLTCEPLVSATSPVWPAEEKALGGIVPVMVKPASTSNTKFSAPRGPQDACAVTMDGETTWLQSATAIIDEAEGRDYGRLSGLLPVKCCYVQATPSLRALWLGEDRRDVLGAHRMPGQMRWAPGSNRVCDPGQPRGLWEGVFGQEDGGRPALLRMAHEGDEGMLRMVDVEEKGWKGKSEVMVVDGDGVRTKHVVEPRGLTSQQVKRVKLSDEVDYVL